MKLIKISTVPVSLNILLKGQLNYLAQYYNLIAVSGQGRDLDEVAEREGVQTIAIDMERNILRKKFSEMLKPLEGRYQVYRVNYSYVRGDKCSKCNEDRKLEYKTPSGKTAYEDCSCSKTYKVWNTESTEIIRLDLYKDRNYPYSLSVTPKYDGASYDEMYCKFELKTFVENLDDPDMNFDMKEFDYKEVAFKNENDCNKFCDYLNQKEKLPKKILQPKSK